MKIEKILGVTFILLGIVSLIFGVAIVYIHSAISSVTNNPLLGAAAGASGISFVINMLLFVGILELLLGVFSLISAIMLFVQKE